MLQSIVRNVPDSEVLIPNLRKSLTNAIEHHDQEAAVAKLAFAHCTPCKQKNFALQNPVAQFLNSSWDDGKPGLALALGRRKPSLSKWYAFSGLKSKRRFCPSSMKCCPNRRAVI